MIYKLLIALGFQLIQHLQGQAADRAEKVAQIMQNQAERSELEAIAVRIITVIALFYLPATFVGVSCSVRDPR